MGSRFQTVGIMGRSHNKGVEETLKALMTFLNEVKQNFILDTETAALLDHNTVNGCTLSQLDGYCDLMIVVGGDGSLLHAAPAAISAKVPIIGINRGRLGFLTDIHPTELSKIKAILDGQYIKEERFLLNAKVIHQGKMIGENIALNEVALIPDTVPHMNEFEIYIEEQFVLSQASDGVIIATPTGSTAYALSGGGPILHPQLDAIVIVPMFPHTLSIRPLVIEGNREIKIIITPNNSATPRLTCDGKAFINTPPGSHIAIHKLPESLQLIHPLEYNYYKALRSKLHWGHKLHYME